MKKICKRCEVDRHLSQFDIHGGEYNVWCKKCILKNDINRNVTQTVLPEVNDWNHMRCSFGDYEDRLV